MKSRLADDTRRSLNEDVERMTTEQRLAAFLVHGPRMAQLANSVGNDPMHKGRKMPSATPHPCRDAQRGRVCR